MAHKPSNFVVWTEIPATEMDRARKFYRNVFDIETELQTDGPNPTANFVIADLNAGVSGHIYPGKPAVEGNGPTIHFLVPGKLENAIAKVEPSGGKMVSPVIQIPVGRFAYGIDTEGNSIGLFEAA